VQTDLWPLALGRTIFLADNWIYVGRRPIKVDRQIGVKDAPCDDDVEHRDISNVSNISRSIHCHERPRTTISVVLLPPTNDHVTFGDVIARRDRRSAAAEKGRSDEVRAGWTKRPNDAMSADQLTAKRLATESSYQQRQINGSKAAGSTYSRRDPRGAFLGCVAKPSWCSSCDPGRPLTAAVRICSTHTRQIYIQTTVNPFSP